MRVILLRTPGAAPAGSSKVLISAADPQAASIQIDDLSARDLLDAYRDPTVQAVAPPMPTTPIRPVAMAATDSESASAQDPYAVSWGVRAVGADTCPYDGKGVVAAILDTGICSDHPAFAGMHLKQVSFIDGEPQKQEDTVGHGTHCAGTFFGRDVGGRRIGIARGIDRALIARVLHEQGGTTDAISNALLWAYTQQADVLCLSATINFIAHQKRLATEMPEPAAVSTALVEYRANVQLFDRLAELIRPREGGRGVIVVAASGNESARPNFRIAAGPPGATEAFLSIAALGYSAHSSGFEVASFSNTGVRFAAPGVGIRSAWLGRTWRVMSGTSMATPHVAGVAALWAHKLRRPGKPIFGLDVIRRMEATVRELPHDPQDVGLGLVRAPER